MIKKLLLTAVCAFASCAAAKADVVGLYSFTGSSLASSDSNADSVASAITAGSAFTAALTANTTYGNPTPSLAVVSTLTTGATQTAAVTANQYFSFTLTPNTGTPLSLSTLTFDYANYSTDATFPTESFFVRSSVDNFANNTAAGVSSSAASAGAFATATVSLGAAAFQNLATATEFRVYIYDGTTQATRGAVLDNIVVSSVPEPSTWAMMLVGLIGSVTVALRRKRCS